MKAIDRVVAMKITYFYGYSKLQDIAPLQPIIHSIALEWCGLKWNLQ